MGDLFVFSEGLQLLHSVCPSECEIYVNLLGSMLTNQKSIHCLERGRGRERKRERDVKRKKKKRRDKKRPRGSLFVTPPRNTINAGDREL